MHTSISRILFFLLILLASPAAESQEILNRTDPEGRKEGMWKKTDSAGRLIYTGRFSAGIPVDTFRYHYPDGKLKTLSVFSDHGRQVKSVSWYRNGRLMAIGNYLNEKKDGRWQFFSESDTVKVSEENYAGGLKDGVSTVFFQDGTISETVTWKLDVRNGDWTIFYTDGRIKMKGSYLEGEKSGPFNFYFPSGKVMMTGEYLLGHQHGVWKYYDEEGAVVKTETYDHGILVDHTPK